MAPFVAVLVLLGFLVGGPILLAQERWFLAAGLYLVALAAVPLTKAWSRAWGELAQLRRSIEGLSFPVVGVDEWLDPARPRT